jgi:CO/xanthine dehydrogenase FAD-binding subunit
VRPTSVADTVALIGEAGDEGRLLAGGQSLIPLMSLRMAAPGRIIDLGAVTELDYIELDRDRLRIGAMTTYRTIERSPEVAEAAPLLAYSMRYIGHRAIRSRGTIGGSVCHADPAAELPSVLQALGAELVARGAAGERVIASDGFFKTHFTSALQEGELLTEVRVPLAGSRRWSFQEVSRRHGDFAIVLAAIAASGNGAAPRIVLGGLGSTPVRALEAERLLADGDTGPDSIRAVARVAVQDTRPSSDFHASAETRTRIAETLVRRGLARMNGASADTEKGDQ